jgi:hypothetical protein
VTARKGFLVGDRVFVAWFPEDCILMGRDSALPVLEMPSSGAAAENLKPGIPVG